MSKIEIVGTMTLPPVYPNEPYCGQIDYVDIGNGVVAIDHWFSPERVFQMHQCRPLFIGETVPLPEGVVDHYTDENGYIQPR